jgi:hypothetical protein
MIGRIFRVHFDIYKKSWTVTVQLFFLKTLQQAAGDALAVAAQTARAFF